MRTYETQLYHCNRWFYYFDCRNRYFL